MQLGIGNSTLKKLLNFKRFKEKGAEMVPVIKWQILM